jgi:murein DD-endopeptidase MepM/ murein hydrolase activator NlpD
MVFSKLKIVFLGVSLFCVNASFSQTKKWTCGSPLEIPLHLAGSFAEIRTNHFHSGLDLRTNEQEGLSVLASGDGFISRVKISPSGYGKALYITHPEGYTTVYGHLQVFSPEIDSLVRLEHFAKESYDLDWHPKAGQIKVSKGQLIALSGNSGSSSGPHVHFEVRETSTELCLDPISLGLPVLDTLAPAIDSFSAWAGRSASELSQNSLPEIASFSEGNGSSSSQPLLIEKGNLELAVRVIDRYVKGSGDCGVKSIRVKVDGVLFYTMEIQSVNFNTTKAINGFVPMGIYKSKSGNWYRCTLPKIQFLKNEVANYYSPLNIQDTAVHEVLFEAEDWNGKVSSAVGYVCASKSPLTRNPNHKLIPAGEEKELFFASGSLVFQKTSLFDDVYVQVVELVRDSLMPPAVEIGHSGIALYTPAKVKFNLSDIPQEMRSKVVVVQENGSNQKSLGGTVEGSYITASATTLGVFSFATDAEAPKVEFVSQRLPKDSARGAIRLAVRDGLSGISSIRPTLDNKWLYYEYDAKNNSVIVELPVSMLDGQPHKLNLKVVDKVGNEFNYKKTFK